MVELLFKVSVAYLVVFCACLPLIAWYKFCTRKLSAEGKKKTFRDFLGNLLTFYGW